MLNDAPYRQSLTYATFVAALGQQNLREDYPFRPRSMCEDIILEQS